MQIAKIQDEIISKAHAEGQVKPDDVSQRLLHDLEDVHAAIQDAVNRGLLQHSNDDTYRLTDRGEAVHRAREDANRAAVISRTSSWQRR